MRTMRGCVGAEPLSFARAKRDRRALRGDERTLGVVDGDVGLHLVAEPLHRGRDRARRAVALGDQPLVDLEAKRAPARTAALADERPKCAHQDGDGDEARQQRQIDLPEQPALDDDHDSPSCFLANT